MIAYMRFIIMKIIIKTNSVLFWVIVTDYNPDFIALYPQMSLGRFHFNLKAAALALGMQRYGAVSAFIDVRNRCRHLFAGTYPLAPGFRDAVGNCTVA